MASGANRNFTCFYVGTGAEQEIEVGGFDPRSVYIMKLSDGAETRWFKHMEVVDAASAGGFTRSALGVVTALTAAAGVSELPNAQGFKIGTDAAVNALGVQYAFVAND